MLPVTKVDGEVCLWFNSRQVVHQGFDFVHARAGAVCGQQQAGAHVRGQVHPALGESNFNL